MTLSTLILKTCAKLLIQQKVKNAKKSHNKISDILKIEDETEKVIALGDYVFNRDQTVGFNNLTETEKVIRCVEKLEQEVNNGGFSQFFDNALVDIALNTVNSLRKIGAHKTVSIVEQALSVFPDSAPPREEAIRAGHAYERTDEDEEKLGKLDTAFFKYEDQLGKMVIAYAEKHREDFHK